MTEASDSVRVPQLWEAVAERMRSAILDGSLAAGAKLLESELAQRFGTSRGPVREAIRELAREGLVAELPRRGTVVSTLTARDLAEVYAIREGLELSASKTLIERVSDARLAGLVEPLRAIASAREAKADYAVVAKHDFAFHTLLVELAGNRRMTGINHTMIAQTALLLRTAAEANPTLRSDLVRPVHEEILEALRARDLRRAREAVELHYRYAEERLFAQIVGR